MAGLKYKDINGTFQKILNYSGLTTHVHGNISNDGKVGTVAGKTLQTDAAGLVVANDLKVGTTADLFLGTGVAGLVEVKTLAQLKALLLDLNHPVGSIFESVDATSPATLFGGTWAALGGRFLIGVDGTYTAGLTGGAAIHAHGLTAGWAKLSNQDGVSMYVHFSQKTVAGQGLYNRYIQGTATGANPTNANPTTATALGGTTDDGSTLPPYLAVYMWKRTA